MPKKKLLTRNNLEEDVLRQLSKGALTVSYETARLPYTISRNYIPDFVVVLPSGYTFYVEVKGYFRAVDQTKMRAVKEANPDLDIRFLFQYDKPVRKGAKMTYSDWADKYHFPWAIKKIPRGWLTNDGPPDYS